MITSKWTGSTDQDDKSGEARFMLGEAAVYISMENFIQYQMLDLMIQKAVNKAKKEGAIEVIRKFEKATEEYME